MATWPSEVLVRLGPQRLSLSAQGLSTRHPVGVLRADGEPAGVVIRPATLFLDREADDSLPAAGVAARALSRRGILSGEGPESMHDGDVLAELADPDFLELHLGTVEDLSESVVMGSADPFPLVPPQAYDIDEVRISHKERREAIGIGGIPRLCESLRDSFGSADRAKGFPGHGRIEST